MPCFIIWQFMVDGFGFRSLGYGAYEALSLGFTDGLRASLLRCLQCKLPGPGICDISTAP